MTIALVSQFHIYFPMVTACLALVGAFSVIVKHENFAKLHLKPYIKILLFLVPDGSTYNFWCKECRKKTAVRKNTILYKSKFSLRRFVLLLYSFTCIYWTYADVTKATVIMTNYPES